MRINVYLTLALILSAIPLLVTAQEPDWLVNLKQQKWMKKIALLELLKTDRSGAEKILGKPDKSDSDDHSTEDYALKAGTVTLDYTTSECTSIDGRFSKDSLESIDFEPKMKISFDKLKIPLEQFEQSSNDTLTDIYQNERYGITFYVHHNRLSSINFEIPEQKNLNCIDIQAFLNELNIVRKIKLLESSRDEVRRIFAAHEFRKDDQTEYQEWIDTDSSRIEFTYSEGECAFELSDGYNTSEWNVERIRIWPQNAIVPKDFGIDLSEYKKERRYINISDPEVFYDKDQGLSFQVSRGKIEMLEFFPSKKNYPLMCDRKKAEKMTLTESLFTDQLKDRIYNPQGPAEVEELRLSQSEITAGCAFAAAPEGQGCSNNQIIKVFTLARNPLNDVLTYSYTISGGKIAGAGARVIWDLSGAKAGTYTITAAVDDGCGFCGKNASRTITVKECSACRPNTKQ